MTVALIVVIFLLFAALMFAGRLPALLALPLMAVAIALAAGVSGQDLAQVVVADGMLRLNAAYTTAIVGAILAEVVRQTGIAETVLKWAAELGGDRPILLTLILIAVSALLFTTLGGLGAVIMVGTIVLPILLSLGLSPLTAASVFLMALSLGGVFNPVNWQFYESVLGLQSADVIRVALILGGLLALVTAAFLIWEVKRGGLRRYWAEPAEPRNRAPWWALVTPIVPIVLVLAFHFWGVYQKRLDPTETPFALPILAAMLVGVAYGVLTTLRRGRSAIQLVSRATFEGIGNVAPAVALMMGIGMVMNAVIGPDMAKAADWPVIAALQPVLLRLTPTTAIGIVLGFGLLAPLALYRGPLNLWGMGAGIAAAMLGVGALPAASIMAVFFSVGLVQGICDPTNTHNVWVATYVSSDVQAILRKTLPWIWAAAIAGLALTAALSP